MYSIQGRIKANLCPKHMPTLVPPVFSTGIIYKLTRSLDAKTQHNCQCLTLNSELNFQSGQTSYIKIVLMYK
jgi:hypothetical protein